MAFSAKEVMPGVHHIQDGMGVCMTLLVGREQALLVDTGYGLEDVAAYVRSITALPLTVLLTHGHHDHALGARWFPKTLMFPEDQQEFLDCVGEASRLRILNQAREKHLIVDEARFLNDVIPMPEPLTERTLPLGGITAEIIRCPGHTRGSAVVYVPERQLLLSGDDWNPCTWVFFPSSLPIKEYRANLRALAVMPFTHVLCSHRHNLFERSTLDAFLAALTDDALLASPAVRIEPYQNIDTHQVDLPEGQWLVFDWNKAEMKG